MVRWGGVVEKGAWVEETPSGGFRFSPKRTKLDGTDGKKKSGRRTHKKTHNPHTDRVRNGRYSTFDGRGSLERFFSKESRIYHRPKRTLYGEVGVLLASTGHGTKRRKGNGPVSGSR